MSQARSGGGGLARVKAKLEDSLKRGDFYEAHQMYRTLHFRYYSTFYPFSLCFLHVLPLNCFFNSIFAIRNI